MSDSFAQSNPWQFTIIVVVGIVAVVVFLCGWPGRNRSDDDDE